MLMKKMTKYLCIVSLFMVTQLNAQYTITAIPPGGTTFTFDQLWNFTSTAPNPTNYVDFYVSMRIYDDQGNLLVKSNSNTFGLASFTLMVTPLNLGPLASLNTLYYDNTLQSAIQNGGFFPPGMYNIQFILLGRPQDGEFTELADYNYEAIVEAFWPPMLLYPYNEDTIDNPLPVLMWTPAYYASPGTSIEYSLWLVKMNANQDPYQAITSNPYVLQMNNLPATTQPYPPSAYAMQIGDQFAWQVAATVNNQPIAYTEVWTFVYYVDSILDTVPEVHNIYFNLKRISEITGGLEALVSVEDYIRFQFDHEYFIPDTAKIDFVIKDDKDSTVFSSLQSNVFPVSFGMNRYVLDPCQLDLDVSEPYYKLIAFNTKDEEYYMYFKISNTVTCPH